MPNAEAVSVGALPDEGLRRGLGRFHVLAICVGSIVGTGIYIRPAGIAQLLHTPGRVLLLWCAAGLLCLAGALTYAELAARFPRSGGEYAFLRETLGELPAFLFGWMRLTVGVGSMAALGAAVAIFVADLIPLAGTTWHLKLMSPWGNIPILLGVSQAVAALTILVLAVLNISGVARAGRFQGVITTLKVVGLTGLIVAIALLGRPHAAARHFIASSDAAPGVLAWGTALLAAVAAYDGWARVPMVAGEIRDPRRTLPWAIVTGLAIATVLYLTTNAAFLRVLTIDQVMASSSTAHPDAPSVASRAVATALSVNAAGLLSLLFLLSALGALHCGLLTVPRVLFAMARDGLLPRRLSGIAESARTPAVAITTVALLAVTLALLSGYERLSNMAVFGNLTFYAVNSFGLLWWRHRSTSRNDVALFRAPRGIPQLFLGAVLALLIVLVAGKSTEVLAGLALMGLGVPVYVAIRARRGAGTRVGAEHSQ